MDIERDTIFEQMVEDPFELSQMSAADHQDKDKERARLFGIIKEFAKSDNPNNKRVHKAAP